MNLAFRAKPVVDFDWYYEMDYVGGMGFDPGPEFRSIIREEYALFNKAAEPCWMVAHDLDKSPDTEIAFVAGCYLKEWAVEKIVRAESPFPHPKFIKWISDGRNPFVTGDEVGEANAGDGLSLMVTHFSWDQSLAEEDAALVRSLVLVRFSEYYAGAKYRRMIAEVYSDASYLECLNAGYSVRNTYPNWIDTRANPPCQPLLMVLEKEDALKGANYSMMRLFAYQKPTLLFTEGQREVLLLARFGYTDQQIASETYISEDAVKARWKSIYARVEERLPGLLPGVEFSSRGPEKRRQLLAYLQNHPSEFWPYAT